MWTVVSIYRRADSDTSVHCWSEGCQSFGADSNSRSGYDHGDSTINSDVGNSVLLGRIAVLHFVPKARKV